MRSDAEGMGRDSRDVRARSPSRGGGGGGGEMERCIFYDRYYNCKFGRTCRQVSVAQAAQRGLSG
jgi:hypothetical protein